MTGQWLTLQFDNNRRPRFYIKVDPTDNVAIIVNDRGLTAGTRFPDGLTLVEHILQGHKVATGGYPRPW